MAITARYWRVRQMVPPGDGLIFGEFQFAANVSSPSQVSITGLALSATVAPSTGTVAQINDNDLLSVVQWAPAGALEITWDFGSTRTIGAYGCATAFLG